MIVREGPSRDPGRACLILGPRSGYGFPGIPSNLGSQKSIFYKTSNEHKKKEIQTNVEKSKKIEDGILLGSRIRRTCFAESGAQGTAHEKEKNKYVHPVIQTPLPLGPLSTTLGSPRNANPETVRPRVSSGFPRYLPQLPRDNLPKDLLYLLLSLSRISKQFPHKKG